jgi:hypothetical protein
MSEAGRLSQQVQSKRNRQNQLFRETVEFAALKPPPPTSEQSAYGLEILIKLWNEGAERIETMGYSFPVTLEYRGALEFTFNNPERFPFNRAFATLLVLTEMPGHDGIFDIMRDALLRLEVPRSDIDYHATAADGLWLTSWRKDKVGQAAQSAASKAWEEREKAEYLEAGNTGAKRNKIAGLDAVLDAIIRANPGLKDSPTGRFWYDELRPTESWWGEVYRHGRSFKDNAPRDDAKMRAQKLREVFDGLAGMSYRAAAEELNRRGIKTEAGGRWFPMQVKRVSDRLRKK